MPTRHRLSAGFLLSGLLGFGASAQDAICLGNLGSVEVAGDLNIVAGCRLTGTDVRGNVRLFAGGSLIARDARIFGNVEGRRGNFVDIDESLIDGNVRLEEFVGDLSAIQRTNVRGNADLTGNRSRLEIVNNDIAGNVQVSRNRGGVLISGNAIDGDLRCTGNDPEPDGLANQVERNVRGQCQDLESTPRAEPPPPATPPAPMPPTTPTPPPTTSRPPPTTSTPPPTTSTPPPTTSAPPPTTSTPPPTTSTPRPTTSTPPPTTSTPPPTTSTPPPTTSTPPPTTSTPPPAATPVDPVIEDEGGAGAFGWSVLFLLPLLAWSRRRPRRT